MKVKSLTVSFRIKTKFIGKTQGVRTCICVSLFVCHSVYSLCVHMCVYDSKAGNRNPINSMSLWKENEIVF